jgi:hypothetical protein
LADYTCISCFDTRICNLDHEKRRSQKIRESRSARTKGSKEAFTSIIVLFGICHNLMSLRSLSDLYMNRFASSIEVPLGLTGIVTSAKGLKII